MYLGVCMYACMHVCMHLFHRSFVRSLAYLEPHWKRSFPLGSNRRWASLLLFPIHSFSMIALVEHRRQTMTDFLLFSKIPACGRDFVLVPDYELAKTAPRLHWGVFYENWVHHNTILYRKTKLFSSINSQHQQTYCWSLVLDERTTLLIPQGSPELSRYKVVKFTQIGLRS